MEGSESFIPKFFCRMLLIDIKNSFMTSKIQILITSFLTCVLMQTSFSQVFKGEVIDLQQQSLPYANAQWLGSNVMSIADEKGSFEIPYPSDTLNKPYKLVISFSGARDTFSFDDLHDVWVFTLSANVTLQEVKVYDRQRGAYISELQPIKTEIINRNELRKAACCDLAGCFETQSTVQPQITNILTNAKELRILGLSGVYNQVLVDGLPLIQGLTYTYGISTIPGSMLDNIWVVKGANSVLQGFENMVGQITVFPREGGTADPFTADILVNSFGEKHLNAGMALKRQNWNNYLAIHTSQHGNKFDRDEDGFLDLPLLTRYSVYNKWRYRKENENGISSFIAGRLVDEKRIGGQKNFNPDTDKGSTKAYGQTVEFLQSEILTKTGWRFDSNHKVSLLSNLTSHHQDSWFGVMSYKAKQINWYTNLQYELFYGKKKEHDLKAGVSFRSLNINENLNFASDTVKRTFAGEYIKEERIPGVFIENIFNFEDLHLTLITGVRADIHNKFGGFATPRAMLRYQPAVNTDLRFSIGTGWRTVNLFSENINLLTTNRDIIFLEKLQPEKAINLGINATQKFSLVGGDFTATVDLYHTNFQNQFFPDYEQYPDKVVIANFTKASISNGLQTELSASFIDQFNIRVAYNFLDVYRRPVDEKVLLPFNPMHKLLTVLSVHSKIPKWQIDCNFHWYGKQRLPVYHSPQIEVIPNKFSSPFSLISLQYTHVFKEWEIFGGCENILDFRQLQPIVDFKNPFGRNFDTTLAWGPTRGREFYCGIRIRLVKINEGL